MDIYLILTEPFAEEAIFHWCPFLETLSRIMCLWLQRFISRTSILFHWSICLFSAHLMLVLFLLLCSIIWNLVLWYVKHYFYLLRIAITFAALFSFQLCGGAIRWNYLLRSRRLKLLNLSAKFNNTPWGHLT